MTRLGSWISLLVVTALVACNGGSANNGVKGAAELPLVTPSVRAALPSGLIPPKAAAANDSWFRARQGLSLGNFRSRFFSGEGPTDLLRILRDVDARITEINTRGS